MNDRYLYRAKRMDNGEWTYGYLYGIWEIKYILWGMTNNVPDMTEVEPSTICQCTGLKDKSGKLIWENDIVRIVYNGIEYIYKVIWDVSELDFKATNGKENYKSNFQYLTCCEEIEIIENIFDNPELLKE